MLCGCSFFSQFTPEFSNFCENIIQENGYMIEVVGKHLGQEKMK
jgi:hypothetical protein